MGKAADQWRNHPNFEDPHMEAAKKDGLEAGRAELKKIAQTCQACHQR
jgi:hypothetical protein